MVTSANQDVLVQIKQLNNSEAFLEIPTSISYKDLHGVYLAANYAFLQLIGVPSLRDVIGKTDKDLPWAELTNTFRRSELQVIETNEALELETVIVTHNKHMLLKTIRKPIKNTHGEIVAIIIDIIDQSFNQNTKHDLKDNNICQDDNKSMVYLNDVIAYIPGALYWKDYNGRYLGGNDPFLKICGLDFLADLIGKTDKDLPWRDHHEELRKNDLYVMETGNTIKIEEVCKTFGEGNRIFLSHKKPVRDKAGNIIGVIGNSMDITKQKELEKTLKVAKHKAEIENNLHFQFVTNMSRDLLSPAHSFANISKAIANDETDQKKKKKLQMLAYSSEQLLKLINEILELNFSNNYIPPFTQNKFNLKKLMQNVIDLETPAANLKNLELTCDIADDVPEFIINDDFRLFRLVLNLISNGIKFTEVGSVKLKVNLLEKTHDNISLQFEVIDTGIGFPQDRANLIFEQATSPQQSKQNMYFNSGGGLRVVKQFANDLNGKISVISQANQGTIVSCYIPFPTTLQFSMWVRTPNKGNIESIS